MAFCVQVRFDIFNYKVRPEQLTATLNKQRSF